LIKIKKGEKMFEGKLMIVVASPSGRDNIFVGYTKRINDMIVIEKASMIMYYEKVGILGCATQPEQATRLRPIEGGNRVIVNLASLAYAVEADEKAWAEHLGVSR
jgi:hypothetical protein